MRTAEAGLAADIVGFVTTAQEAECHLLLVVVQAFATADTQADTGAVACRCAAVATDQDGGSVEAAAAAIGRLVDSVGMEECHSCLLLQVIL